MKIRYFSFLVVFLFVSWGFLAPPSIGLPLQHDSNEWIKASDAPLELHGEGGTSWSNFSVIEDLYISGAGGYGISLSNCQYMLIRNCTIEMSGDFGITCENSNNIIIQNCTVSSNSHNIRIWDSCYNITINNNTVFGSHLGCGIVLGAYSENCTVSNNRVFDISGVACISIYGYSGTCYNNTIENNSIDGGPEGIDVRESEFSRILNNSIEEASEGIYVEWSTNTTISNNTWNFCGQWDDRASIHLYHSDDNQVVYNTINYYNNSNTIINDGNNNSIHDNIFDCYPYARFMIINSENYSLYEKMCSNESHLYPLEINESDELHLLFNFTLVNGSTTYYIRGQDGDWPTTITWNMGNGEFIHDLKSFTWSYQEGGRYNITLTIVDADGDSSWSYFEILVKDIIQPGPNYDFLVFLILIISIPIALAIVLYLTRSQWIGPLKSKGRQLFNHDPERILKQRFARGEIPEDEYLRKKELLDV